MADKGLGGLAARARLIDWVASPGSRPHASYPRRMASLVDQLEEVARGYLLAELPADQAAELAQESLADLLITIFNWRTRLIPPVPRVCHQSAQLRASTKATEHATALTALIEKIEAGDDLTPHLSRAVKFAHDPKGRRDKDRLIADWGLHHLHLSGTVEADGFVERDDDLLIAAFTPADAYIVGVYPHGSWALKELLTVIVRNWPDSGVMLKLSGIVGLEPEPTDEERLAMRNAGVAGSMITIEGAIWSAAALGQTTAGTSSAATHRSNVVMHTLGDWRRNLPAKLANATVNANAAAGRVVLGRWTPGIHDGVLGLHRSDLFYEIVRLD